MLWVIQENFKDEHNYDNLISQLERQGVPYQQVKMIPFGDTTEPDISPPNPVFVIGGTSMKKVSKKKNWQPGYFYQNIDYRNLIQNYEENMLNFGGISGPIGSVDPSYEEFFARPCNDGKQFSGTVFKKADFVAWQKKIIELNGEQSSYVSISPEDHVFISCLKEIYEEYRFFVIDGRVITGSRYKSGGFVRYSGHVDQYLFDFAQKMADTWSPNDAYCLDICTTPDGLKVMEINSINSAGFYDCDMGKFVAAIQDLIRKKYSL